MPRTSLAPVAALAVAFALTAAVVDPSPASAMSITVDDWSALHSAFSTPYTDSVIVLGADISAPAAESLLMVSGSSLVLDLNGYTLTVGPAASGRPAVGVPSGAALTIEGTTGGTLVATGGSDAAAIGGGELAAGGSVTLNGGTVIAQGGANAAGIGGGAGGPEIDWFNEERFASGPVTINGGSVSATGGQYGAGIGGGRNVFGSGHLQIVSGPITINDGTVVATGGFSAPGIGGDRGGVTTINGGGVTASAGAGWGAAGIGGGNRGSGGEITITGGTVTARGTSSAAGIGGGDGGLAEGDRYRDPGTIISITGGETTAYGGVQGAGIGSGRSADYGGVITISGGVVTSTGGSSGGAGIGGGHGTDGPVLTVSGGTISAVGGSYGPGIGGSQDDGGDITVTGGKITALGGVQSAGIGGGAGIDGARLVVSGGAVDATGGEYGAGIGGGSRFGDGGSVIITGGTVTATGGLRSAGIGGAGTSRDDEVGGEPGTLAITGTPLPGSASTGGGLQGSPITNPSQPAGLGYSATVTADPTRFEIVFSYRLGFDSAGGTAIADQNVVVGTAAAQPPPPTRYGFVFGGWNANGAAFDFAAPLAGPLVLTAVWAVADRHRITFDAAGGSLVVEQNIYTGDRVSEPSAPTRQGFSFAGWTLDGVPYDFAMPVSGPLTLTAHWTTDDAPPPVPTTHRLAGPDRFATAVAVSMSAFEGGADTVFVATGLGFADALSAAPAAAIEGAPLLLTSPTSLPALVRAEILRLDPERVVIVGGLGAVSAEVERDIRRLPIAPDVDRISGVDRYATSRAIVREYFPRSHSAFIATGVNFPDALAAGPAAAKIGAPVILVPGDASTADAATVSILERLEVSRVFVAGGTGAVSQGIVRRVDRLSGVSVERLAGSDRYSTAVVINEAVFGTASRVYLATGENFADALAGGAAAAHHGAPLYTTPPRCVPANVRESISDRAMSRVYILGGRSVLGTVVERLGTC